MNNLLSLLGLGAVALYFSQNKTDLEKEIESLRKALQSANDSLEDAEFKLEEKEIEEEQNEASSKNFGVDLKLKMSRFSFFKNPGYYSARCEITIQNNTTKNVFTFKRVAAVLTLNGHTNVWYAFGQEKTVTLRPGEKATFVCAFNTQKWFEHTEDAIAFNKQYFERDEETLDWLLRDDEHIEWGEGVMFANYIRAEINNGIEDTVETWNTVPGKFETYGILKNWKEIGDNAYSDGKYSKLI